MEVSHLQLRLEGLTISNLSIQIFLSLITEQLPKQTLEQVLQCLLILQFLLHLIYLPCQPVQLAHHWYLFQAWVQLHKLGSVLQEELLRICSRFNKFLKHILKQRKMMLLHFSCETYTLLEDPIEKLIILHMDLMVLIQEVKIQSLKILKRELMEAIFELKQSLMNIEKEHRNIETRQKTHMLTLE